MNARVLLVKPYKMYNAEVISLTLLILQTSAVLLPKGPDAVEVREDFLYEHVLTQPVRFAGMTYTSVFISENGVISLDQTFVGGALDKYTSYTPWIAPYGADVGGGSYGLLYFYEVPSTGTATISTVEEMIQAEYPDAFTATSISLLLIVTWENVRSFPATADNTLTNTFQGALVSDGTQTYAIFLYDDLQWSPAVAGISSGSPGQMFTICGSHTTVVQSLGDMGQNECNNTPGQFVFRADSDSWVLGSYTCTQISSYRDCSLPATNTASRLRRCPAR